VAVRGYPSQFLSDRALYNDFWRAGYLKQVEIQKGVGYLHFGTEEDAAHAVQMNHGMRIANVRIIVELIPE
jgi:RNA recognition motif-containing protein